MDDRNIVLVVLDTVSASHLPMYGYERDTTPFLSELADRNVLFKNAFSDSPWTAPSHTSMFTGKSSDRHITGTKSPYMVGRSFVEDLSEKGYYTAGFSQNGMVSSELNFDKGFDKFNSGRTRIIMEENGFENLYSVVSEIDEDTEGVYRYIEAMEQVVAQRRPEAIPEAIKYLSAKKLSGFDILDRIVESSLSHIQDRDRFFLFTNFIHAHRPYIPDGGSEWLDDTEDAIDIHRRIYETQEDFWYKQLSEENRESFRALYDTCIKELDRKLEGLYNRVMDENPDTVFIVTSDHGENIGENGMRGHECGIWEELVRVPLIIAGREIPDRQIEEQAAIKNIPRFIRTGDIEELKEEEITGRYEGRIHLEDRRSEQLDEEEVKYITNTSELTIEDNEGEINHSNLQNSRFL